MALRPRRFVRPGFNVDRNQPAIVAGLRQLGYLVTPISVVGKGCGDLLVRRRGPGHRIRVLEVKQPNGIVSDEQRAWLELWDGAVVRSLEDAVRAMESFAFSPP